MKRDLELKIQQDGEYTCVCEKKDIIEDPNKEPEKEKKVSIYDLIFSVSIPFILLSAVIITVVYVEKRELPFLITMCILWSLWLILSGVYKIAFGGNLLKILKPKIISRAALAGAVGVTTHYIMNPNNTSMVIMAIMWPLWVLILGLTIYYCGEDQSLSDSIDRAISGIGSF